MRALLKTEKLIKFLKFSEKYSKQNYRKADYIHWYCRTINSTSSSNREFLQYILLLLQTAIHIYAAISYNEL